MRERDGLQFKRSAVVATGFNEMTTSHTLKVNLKPKRIYLVFEFDQNYYYTTYNFIISALCELNVVIERR